MVSFPRRGGIHRGFQRGSRRYPQEPTAAVQTVGEMGTVLRLLAPSTGLEAPQDAEIGSGLMGEGVIASGGRAETAERVLGKPCRQGQEGLAE